MNKTPRVAAIVIFLNAEKFLPEAIDSIFAQTYEDWELLLVDDGSTDESTAIACRYAGRYPAKVRYLEHDGHHNRGMPASRNLGIRGARGELIAFLDADDVWLPEKLEQQVAILEDYSEAALVYGKDQYWYSWSGDPGDLHRDVIRPLGVQPNSLIQPPTLVRLFQQAKATVPCPSGILARRSAIESVGGFEEAFRDIYSIYEDQAFYAKLLLKYPAFAADQCWDRYRQHPEATSAIVKRAGQRQAARKFFKTWLAGYLRKQGVRDPEIWQSLREDLWRYRHPNLYNLFSGARQRVRQVQARLFPNG